MDSFQDDLAGQGGSGRYTLAKWLKHALKSVLSILVVSCALPAYAQDVKKIFFLHSYNEGYAWQDSVDQAVSDTLKQSQYRMEIYHEYMDSLRRPGRQKQDALFKYIKSFYLDLKFDIILASDNEALRFLLDHRDQLFGLTPVVFMGINGYSPALLGNRKGYTGVAEDIDILSTLKIARKIRPETKRVVIYGSQSQTFEAHARQIQDALQQIGQSIEARISVGLNLSQVLQEVRELGPENMVLLTEPVPNEDGRSIPFSQSTPLISQASPVPIFSLWDVVVGKGILGGKVVSAREQGKLGAEMAIKIMDGMDPATLPVVTASPNKYMFDYQQLTRFNIPASELPEDSVVINKPDSVWERYRIYILSSVGIFSVMLLVIVGLTRTVLARRRAESALRESEERYQALFEQAGDGIFTLDTQGKILAVNNKFAELHGFTVDEMLSKGIERLDVEGMSPVPERIDRIMNGETLSFEVEHYHKDGHTFPLAVTANLISAGNKRFIMAIHHDLTERQRVEEEKRLLKERLNRAEKMEALGTLAGGVAHDLNNVLGIVVGYTELLIEELAESSPMRPDLLKVLESGKRSAAIVQDLLTLARRGVQAKKVVNLNEIIKAYQAMPEYERFLSSNRHITFRSDLAEDSLNIMGSAVHLGKAFINLVTNAVEAMPEGGVLAIATRNQSLDRPVQGYDDVKVGDYVVLSITDTGEGIAESNITHIFEPFYTKKVMGRSGTGLGLSVVWGTVKDHDGYINVQSKVGKGTTFTLYFPVTREEAEKSSGSRPLSDYIGHGESILVIDDIKEQRELAAKILGKLNYRVKTVASGEEAVEYLKNKTADLVVLDMIMDPGMDGLDTYKAILAIHPTQKAVIVSGFSETARVQEAKALGAGDYLRKPYVIERLGLAVRKELGRHER